MKQLIVYFSVMAVLLLLLPLPALELAGAAQSAESSSTAPRTLTADRTTTSSSRRSTTAARQTTTAGAPAAEQAVFRVRLGEEIRELDEKTFLRAVVTCEMPLSYSEEALKAQTVASYTYFCRQRKEARAAGETADFSDVPSRFEQCSTEAGLKERLGDYYDTYAAKLDRVIDEVYGYTIRYNGEPVLAAYHAISAGVTESAQAVWAADYPYLQAVPSPGDTAAADYTVQQSFTEEEVQAAFGDVEEIRFTGKPETWFENVERLESGLVTGLTVCGTAQTGTQVRKALGLRSANFSVDYKDELFTFTVTGYGHGVGLSQYGAQCMAQQGSDWREILQHYYTDITIEKSA